MCCLRVANEKQCLGFIARMACLRRFQLIHGYEVLYLSKGSSRFTVQSCFSFVGIHLDFTKMAIPRVGKSSQEFAY
jgi:hypothetical protein